MRAPATSVRLCVVVIGPCDVVVRLGRDIWWDAPRDVATSAGVRLIDEVTQFIRNRRRPDAS